ncbi:AbrB/MazE/SpoVT family DNA-binding domain-containing protein [Candidatus Dojkabacteria bacterium]|uniref:AbrB/MazE/SpoVT family DNA-binding domain-containing protein n=1 Tax=Candidatus Dojkabacteria bacterium TaxID=2099670 RepID=A0A955LA79_9BACT|nr:AbrB/MazE/SpoVT family DNA-binding domain-containing protein [Candidatus Dojkabacteria bacterium]
MTVKLQKVGNSMMITLPTKIIKEAGFQKGDQLEVVMEEGEVKVQKKRKKKINDIMNLAGIIKLGRQVTNEEIQELLDKRYEDR